MAGKRPNFMKDYLPPTQRLMYGDQKGRAFSEQYNSRFAKSGIDLAPMTLPGALPGQINIQGVDGGQVWHTLNSPRIVPFLVGETANGDKKYIILSRGMEPQYVLDPSQVQICKRVKDQGSHGPTNRPPIISTDNTVTWEVADLYPHYYSLTVTTGSRHYEERYDHNLVTNKGTVFGKGYYTQISDTTYTTDWPGLPNKPIPWADFPQQFMTLARTSSSTVWVSAAAFATDAMMLMNISITVTSTATSNSKTTYTVHDPNAFPPNYTQKSQSDEGGTSTLEGRIIFSGVNPHEAVIPPMVLVKAYMFSNSLVAPEIEQSEAWDPYKRTWSPYHGYQYPIYSYTNSSPATDTILFCCMDGVSIPPLGIVTDIKDLWLGYHDAQTGLELFALKDSPFYVEERSEQSGHEEVDFYLNMPVGGEIMKLWVGRATKFEGSFFQAEVGLCILT